MAIPVPDQPFAPEPPPPSEVTISIGDGKEQVSAGQMVRYEVVVRNAGAVEAPLTVKLTMPAHAVTSLEASDATGVAVIANAVAWRGVLGAGEIRTYSLAGRVDRATRARSLAVTACVHDRLNAPAVACATDRNELAVARKDDNNGTKRMAWLGSILFGILAVIGAIWLYRKVNPEPLTPATAPASVNEPAAQPGGAPPA